MKLAVVIGQVVSTIKAPGLHLDRLLLVDFLNADGQPAGSPHVAVDSIGAGDGEWVLVTQGSSARRTSAAEESLPVDMRIIGIIDEVVIKNRVAYQK
jgi:ethanolamine utilization protein EutN